MAAVDVHYSRVNPKWDFNAQKAVVSLVNAGSKAGGHILIVVEWLQNAKPFQRQFDITAAEYEPSDFQTSLGNKQGFINKIRAFQTLHPSLDFSKLSSTNWYASPEQIQALENSIIAKQAIVKAETDDKGNLLEGKVPTFKYQVAGSRRWAVFGGNGGDNCLTWAQKELIDAHILNNGEDAKKIDIFKAAPQAHMNWSHHDQPT